jgi:hypothetical protein
LPLGAISLGSTRLGQAVHVDRQSQTRSIAFTEKESTMFCFRLISGLIALAVLAGCEPVTPANQADYERHKANREAYLYQGI